MLFSGLAYTILVLAHGGRLPVRVEGVQKMRPDHILPCALVVIMAAAGVVSVFCGRLYDGVYWFCAAGLNVAVILNGR